MLESEPLRYLGGADEVVEVHAGRHALNYLRVRHIRTYVHWLRNDRDVPAEILDRVLAPAGVSQMCHDDATDG